MLTSCNLNAIESPGFQTSKTAPHLSTRRALAREHESEADEDRSKTTKWNTAIPILWLFIAKTSTKNNKNLNYTAHASVS